MDKYNFGIFSLESQNSDSYKLKPFYLHETENSQNPQKKLEKPRSLLREKIRIFIKKKAKKNVLMVADFLKNEFFLDHYVVKNMDIFFQAMFFGDLDLINKLPSKTKRIFVRAFHQRLFSYKQVNLMDSGFKKKMFKSAKAPPVSRSVTRDYHVEPRRHLKEVRSSSRGGVSVRRSCTPTELDQSD